MSKFTPGPWACTDKKGIWLSDDNWSIPDWQGNGRGSSSTLFVMKEKKTVAILPERGLGENDALHEANARLIAAAPDLIEALQSAISMLNTKDLDGSDTQEIDRIENIIAKATKGDE